MMKDVVIDGVRIQIRPVSESMLSTAFDYAYTVSGQGMKTPIHGFISAMNKEGVVASEDEVLVWLIRRYVGESNGKDRQWVYV